MTCTRCSSTLGRYNTSGLCRACFLANPPASVRANRGAALRSFYQRNPAARKANGERIATRMRMPEARAAASTRCKTHRIWEHSSQTGVPPPPGSRWPKLPPEYLTLYKSLRRKKMNRPDSLRAVNEQMEADARRAGQ